MIQILLGARIHHNSFHHFHTNSSVLVLQLTVLSARSVYVATNDYTSDTSELIWQVRTHYSIFIILVGEMVDLRMKQKAIYMK